MQGEASDRGGTAPIGFTSSRADRPAVTPATDLSCSRPRLRRCISIRALTLPRCFHHPIKLLDRNQLSAPLEPDHREAPAQFGIGDFCSAHTSESSATSCMLQHEHGRGLITARALYSNSFAVAARRGLQRARPSDCGGIVQTSVTLPLDGTQAAFESRPTTQPAMPTSSC